MVISQKTMIPKRFVLTVLLATAFFVGTYVGWTPFVNPRPTPVADDGVKTEQNIAVPTANPTMVTASSNNNGIPERIGALALTNSARGKEALLEFEKLHGKGFDLVSGFRANYANAESKATLWEGQAQDSTAAEQMTKTMAEKIGAGNKMFTDLTELSIADRPLYTVNGQGQQHFFYATNDKIVWLAIDSALAPGALHSLWGAVK